MKPSHLIVCSRQGNAREKITGDAVKQWNIVRQELRFIYVFDGSEQLGLEEEGTQVHHSLILAM